MPNFDFTDLQLPLEQYHKEAMLEVILAWGELDGTVRWFLSALLGLDMPSGAEMLSRAKVSDTFRKIEVELKRLGAQGPARSFRKQKKLSEKHCETRNVIAHSKCVGFSRKRPDFVVFLSFERREDGLAADAVPLDEMRRSSVWARGMSRYLLGVLKAANGDV